MIHDENDHDLDYCEQERTCRQAPTCFQDLTAPFKSVPTNTYQYHDYCQYNFFLYLYIYINLIKGHSDKFALYCLMTTL